MADSIDRVFAHALQTVRKLPRTGSARPPTQDRLMLYGLYKQSMEGDVEGVMARPAYAPAELATSAEARAELEKWEAWSACAGLTRTQAKTKYIDTLIATMHAYASGTPESRGLVQELEFVWDQVRSNAAAGGLVEEEREQRERGRRRSSRQGSSRSGAPRRGRKVRTEGGLRVLRPMSEGDSQSLGEGDEEEEDDDDGDMMDERDENALTEEEEDELYEEEEEGAPPSTRKWQSRMESAVMRLTAEVAAVREQLDGANHSLWAMMRSSRIGDGSGKPWLKFLVWRACLLTKRLVMDAMAIAVLMTLWRLWMRWKTGEKDPKKGLKREVSAFREGIEMVEAWIGFWWTRWRNGLRTLGSG